MRYSALRSALCLGALTVTAAACATATRPGIDPLAAKTIQSSRSVLTRSEILAQDTGRNLFDVVLRLRPRFLRGRYGLPTLAVNGVLMGNASFLSSISPFEVESIQLLDALDATTQFGSRHNGSVLLVTTRPR